MTVDVAGARHLAARIRAGVRIGQVIELVADAETDGLRAGDRGVVEKISEEGNVLIAWERGPTVEIDPTTTQIRPAA